MLTLEPAGVNEPLLKMSKQVRNNTQKKKAHKRPAETTLQPRGRCFRRHDGRRCEFDLVAAGDEL